jgi:DoxX-like protein
MTNFRTMPKAYWLATIVFALLLLMDGFGGVMRAPQGEEVLLHLGYPLYLMPFMGTLKILAAVAIVQSRFPTVKEWAYAGFSFNCLGAFVSRFTVGDGGIDLIFPWIFLLIGAVSYVLWKKRDGRQSLNIAAI